MTDATSLTTLTEQEAEQRALDTETKTEETTVKTKTAKGWRLQRLTAKGNPSKASKDTTTHTTKKSATALAKNSPQYSWLISNLAKPDVPAITLSFTAPDPVEEPVVEKPAKTKKVVKDERPLVTALVRCSGIITPSGPTVTVIWADGSLAGKWSYDSNAWSEFIEGQHIQATFRVDEAKGKRMIKSAILATADQIEDGYNQALMEAISLG